MRLIRPWLPCSFLLPLAVGCAPISAPAVPPGGGSGSHSGSQVGVGAETKNLAAPDPVRIAKTPVDEKVSSSRTPSQAAPAAVLVNQLGYLPGMVKLATVRTGDNTPRTWRLLDSTGKEVLSGQTQVARTDELAGDTVHVADFSAFTQTGRAFTLVVGQDASHPFDVAPDLYGRLKHDALAFFFHNRSGIEIAMPHAGKPEWARPAGHLSDKSVPCAPYSGCDYRLDVAGGWYDAGDHGKYVVNAGITVWTLLNLYERTKFLGRSLDQLGDGRLNIPENRNGVSDLLDEVRWEMEFLLKMQAPKGARAGMVHHKIHDKEWTGLGLAPHEDPKERCLYAPSTAATLNLAAVAAQAARIWKDIDKKFAKACLRAAEKAWQAAKRNPAVPAASGGMGGGPYDDKKLDDEFHWAAAELFITTKRPEYRKALAASPYYLKIAPRLPAESGDGIASPMTWQDVASLGTISLAVVPNALGAGAIKNARAAVRNAADVYLNILRTRGYRVPVDYGTAGKAPWGSTSVLLNNLVVLGLAHDLFDGQEYLNAVAAGMDYILGRNPLDQSYITGYGFRPLRNPHHRFWAHQANPKYPAPPPGLVSGGPNSSLQDPFAQAAGLPGCAPEKCFVDHIESCSTNEIAINWNAPLAWVLAFLDEQAGGAARPSGKN